MLLITERRQKPHCWLARLSTQLTRCSYHKMFPPFAGIMSALFMEISQKSSGVYGLKADLCGVSIICLYCILSIINLKLQHPNNQLLTAWLCPPMFESLFMEQTIISYFRLPTCANLFLLKLNQEICIRLHDTFLYFLTQFANSYDVLLDVPPVAMINSDPPTQQHART